MNAGTVCLQVQASLGIPEASRAPRIGPLTRARIEVLSKLRPEQEFEPIQGPPNQTIRLPESTHAGMDERTPIPPDGVRLIPKVALDLVQYFEGCQLKAYTDEVGVWTIGWGHTGLQHKDGTVYRGRVITQAQADDLLDYDMQQFERRVTALVRIPISDYMFGALVAFDFNTGGLDDSTLLLQLNDDDGNIMDAADQFMRWNHAGGRVLRGLTKRRAAERALFLGNETLMADVMADRIDLAQYVKV